MSDTYTSTAEHLGEAATEDHSHSGVAHGSSSLASISENEAQNETKDVLSPEVVAAIRASEEEPFTSDNEHANNSSHRNGYSSEDPPQQIVSREMLRRNRDELVFRPQQTTHKSPPLGRGLRSQPRPSIHNLSSDGGNVSFVEQSQHYARRSSYEDPVVKIRHPRQQQYHQFENQPSEHEGDDQYNYHPSQFQHTYPPNRREHPQHIQPQSGDFGHKRRGNDQGRFQHATTYGASREADMFNTPKYGRLTSKAKDSDLETSGYNNQFRVKFADEVFGDRQGRPLAPHYQEGFPNRLPLEEVVGTAPWQERRISSHSSVDISATSRSSIDGTFISETANSIRRQLRTSNWPAFARSPNHEQSYLPRKRQAALMSILLLMVLFMMLRHGPENLTMYTTVGDESPADKINELRPARGIMDDFNPSMRSIQNNPVKPVPESSVVDGKDEEVFDWSKVPPHLRGYYKTMLENAPKIGIEEIPRIIPKLDASQFEMQQSLLAQNGGFSEGTEVGLMKKQTHPDAVQELLQLNEGIDDEKRLIQEAESDGRLQSLAAEEFGQDANLQSISEEKPVSEDLLELARQQHAEIERAEAERFESNQLSQQEFEAAQTMLEIADEVMNDAPAMPLVPELASKEVIDDMALEEVGQNKVDPILNEEKQVVLAEQSAQDIPPDEVLSTQSTEEKEEESAGDGESDAIGEKRETTPTELEEELLRKEREDERKRQRQDETKALQIELADQPGGSKKNHVAFTGRRILAILDPKTVEHKLVDSGGMLYTSKECPVLHERHSVAYFREDHTWAHKLAREAEVLETVSKAFSSGILDGRKILFVGDSVMQQVFGSIDCLAQTAGLREESDRDNRDDPNPDHQMHPFYFRTSRGGTDVFYSRFFGQMLKYHGAFGTTPLAEEFQWMESCRRREPFRYGSNIETGDRGIYIGRIEEYSMGGEARTLSPNDFVVIHGTLHRERDENISNMKQLFSCMEEARSLGQDPGWPHITVLSTLPQHFHTENGEYSSDGANPAIFDGCRESIDLEKFPPYLEEREIFYGKVPLVGHDLHLEHMGNYHVGKRLDHVKAIDCTHWSMPGVPDFVAKSVLDHIQGVAMSESHSK